MFGGVVLVLFFGLLRFGKIITKFGLWFLNSYVAYNPRWLRWRSKR